MTPPRGGTLGSVTSVATATAGQALTPQLLGSRVVPWGCGDIWPCYSHASERGLGNKSQDFGRISRDARL